MTILTQSELKAQLLENGRRLVKVREAGALSKDLINQAEPQPIATVKGNIQSSTVIKGNN